MNDSRRGNAAEAVEALKSLLFSQKVGVLSTHDGDQPYANIIAFALSDGLDRILFATPRATRKFANLQRRPKAAFLVDNRPRSLADAGDASAATAVGAAYEISPQDREEAESLILGRHPSLEKFIRSGDSALMALEVSSYVLVRGLRDVVELKPPF